MNERRNLWLKYDMYFEYEDKTYSGRGIAHGTCNLRFLSELRFKKLYAMFRRVPLFYAGYIPNENCRGWPKRYYGKKLNVKISKFKITGYAPDESIGEEG